MQEISAKEQKRLQGFIKNPARCGNCMYYVHNTILVRSVFGDKFYAKDTHQRCTNRTFGDNIFKVGKNYYCNQHKFKNGSID